MARTPTRHSGAFLALCVLALVPALGSPAAADLDDRRGLGKSLLRLAAEAELIVTGRVVGFSNVHAAPPAYLRQAPRISVTRVLKGRMAVGADLTVLSPRKTVRGYKPREEVLVFLASTPPDDLGGGRDVVPGRWYSIIHERSKIEILPTNRRELLDAVAQYVRLAGAEADSPALRKVLLDDLRSQSRWVARDAFDELASRPWMVRSLTDDELVYVRRTAYRAESDPYVRAGVIALLRDHAEGDRHLLILLEAMREDWFRRLLIDAAAYRNLAEATGYLAPDLESADAPLRASAARALGMLGHAGHVDALEARAWRDPIVAVEGIAVRAIARIGGARAYEALRRLALEHPNLRIRALAARQIEVAS